MVAADHRIDNLGCSDGTGYNQLHGNLNERVPRHHDATPFKNTKTICLITNYYVKTN